jgi:hypothetical protein
MPDEINERSADMDLWRCHSAALFDRGQSDQVEPFFDLNCSSGVPPHDGTFSDCHVDCSYPQLCRHPDDEIGF